MSHEYRLWAMPLVTSVHVLEERIMDWRTWVKETSGVDFPWSDFSAINGALVAGAVVGARVGWRAPVLSLSIPALTVINAAGFHLAPTLRDRRYSPGALTATLLYLPIGFWIYDGAKRDGVLTKRVGIGSAITGAALMALPFALARSRARHRDEAAVQSTAGAQASRITLR